MRVLINTPSLANLGGVANYYRTLRPYFPDFVSYFPVQDIEREGTRVGLALRLLRKYLRFFLVEVHRADLVVLNPSLNRRAYVRDLLFLLIARLFRKRLVVFFRGWEEPFERRISRGLARGVFRRTYGRADAFIVLGDVFRKKLGRLGVPATTPIHVETTVANALEVAAPRDGADSRAGDEIDLARKAESFDRSAKVILLTRLVEGKGCHEALRIWEAARRGLPQREMELVVAGDGPLLPALRHEVEQRGLERVTFPGYLRGDEKRRLLESAHVLLFTSHSEGLPNAVVESMLHGLTIVSSAVGGIPDVVEPGANGALFEAGDVESATERLVEEVTDVDRFAITSRSNHEKAKARFLARETAERVTRILEDAGGQRARLK